MPPGERSDELLRWGRNADQRQRSCLLPSPAERAEVMATKIETGEVSADGDALHSPAAPG